MKHIIRNSFLWLASLALTLFLCLPSTAQNCNFTIEVPDDITLCNEGFVNLNGQITGDYLNFHWNGSNGYYNDQSLNPNVWVAETTTFTLAAGYISTTNLITNGDFEAGATGFTTQYALTFPGYTCPNGNHVWGMLGCEGTYFVGPSSSAVHTNFANCTPHGGNNMMMLNGANSLQELWCQTITVMPNTDYVFQAFATSIESSSPAILQFAIDGTLLGSPFALSGSTCNWQEFYEIWNSGSNTSIEICITNQNTAVGGNDFALDDIFFGPVCKDSMEFTVYVSDMVVEPPLDGYIDCTTPITSLEVNALPQGGNYVYEWNTSNGVIESDPTQPAIEVSAAGLYLVTVTDELGCSLYEFAHVDAYLDLPDLDISGDNEISCAEPTALLSALASETVDEFVWTLPSGANATGTDLTTDQPGWHFVEAINAFGCIGIDSFYVEYLNTQFVYDVQVSGPLTCKDSIQWIEIQTQSLYDSISWQGDGIVQIMPGQTLVSVGQPGTYGFTFHYGESCFYSDEVSVVLTPPQFSYQILPADTLTCRTLQVPLLANTYNSNAISWYFRDTLMSSPLATTPGKYQALITDINGCTNLDSVDVLADYTQPVAFVTVDTIDCITNAGSFSLDTTSAAGWTWSGPGGTISDQVVTSFGASGDYQLYLIGANGCADTLLYVLPSDIDFPSLLLQPDTITCAKPMGTIFISSNIPVSIEWTGMWDSGTGNEIQSALPGLFMIKATSARGCISTAQVEMAIDTIRPGLEISLSDTLTCLTTSIYPSVNTQNITFFQWSGAITSQQLEPAMNKPGFYTLQVTSANGCTNAVTVEAKANLKKPNPFLNYEDISCAKPQVPLLITDTHSNAYSLEYNNTKTSVVSGDLLDKAGMYRFTATGVNGCDTTLMFEIKSHLEAPMAEIMGTTLTCAQPISTLRNLAFNTDVVTQRWWFNGQSSDKDSLRVEESGIVVLEVTNEWGCEKRDSATILKDVEKPTILLSDDRTILCTAGSVNVALIQPTTGASYQWLDNTGVLIYNGLQLDVTREGSYNIHAYNPKNGCTSDAGFDVLKQGKPETIDIDIDQASCYGQKSHAAIKSIAGGIGPYQIYLDGHSVSLDHTSEVLSGRHELKITDKNGCALDSHFTILETYPFSVDAGQDTLIQLFSSYTLQPSYVLNGNQISAIRWQPHPAISCTDCLQPIVQPEGESTFVIELINQNGCIETDAVTIRVRFDKGITTPNIIRSGSALNQRFTLYNRYQSIQSIAKLSIFDRWGNLVFIQNNFPDSQPEWGWDGSFMGREAVPGVYVWVAEIIYKDGSTESLRGDVTVVR